MAFRTRLPRGRLRRPEWRIWTLSLSLRVGYLASRCPVRAATERRRDGRRGDGQEGEQQAEGPRYGPHPDRAFLREGRDHAHGRGRCPTAIEAIATGAINLDAAIGIGGMPRGRISEIYGPESSGKTTICLQVIANAQKSGGIAAFIDAEHALDVGYARKIGVRTWTTSSSAQPDYRRAGPRDLRHVLVRSEQRDRHHRHRLRRRARPPRPSSKATWATPTSVCRRG